MLESSPPPMQCMPARYAEDAYHEANTGLSPLVAALLSHRIDHRPCITFADLVTLGGAVAVEASGGERVAARARLCCRQA